MTFPSIHPLFVAAALLYAGVMWYFCFKRKVFFDSRLFAFAYLVQAVMYVIFAAVNMPADDRAFYVRISLIVVALSQAVSLHISILREENDAH